VLPAFTGGALDNDELAPGPIMIQGDHSHVGLRKLVVTPITNRERRPTDHGRHGAKSLKASGSRPQGRSLAGFSWEWFDLEKDDVFRSARALEGPERAHLSL